MKWLIIQSDGVHKGQDGWCPNWQFRECYAIRHALEVNGQQVDIWGLRHDNYKQLPDFNSYDVIFTCENYEFSWLPRINDCYRARRLFWVIDAHYQPLNTYAEAIKGYDTILHSTQIFVDPYQKLYPKQKHIYFPNGVDNRYFDRNLHEIRKRTNDLIFIGSKHESRRQAIERMERFCGLRYSYGITGMDYVQEIISAKMQFNAPINGDQNYRNWETVGLGACLLTQYHPALEELGFKHEVNCLFWKGINEAVDLTYHFLKGVDWCSIADAGYEFSKQHTYTKRIGDLITTLNSA